MPKAEKYQHGHVDAYVKLSGVKTQKKKYQKIKKRYFTYKKKKDGEEEGKRRRNTDGVCDIAPGAECKGMDGTGEGESSIRCQVCASETVGSDGSSHPHQACQFDTSYTDGSIHPFAIASLPSEMNGRDEPLRKR